MPEVWQVPNTWRRVRRKKETEMKHMPAFRDPTAKWEGAWHGEQLLINLSGPASWGNVQQGCGRPSRKHREARCPWVHPSIPVVFTPRAFAPFTWEREQSQTAKHQLPRQQEQNQEFK